MADSHQIPVNPGPSLNLRGPREPEIYGSTTLAEINSALESAAKQLGAVVKCFQSHHEGAVIECIHEAIPWADGIRINPGGLTHTSVALHDALAATGKPVVEVHLSNVFAREEFRRHSMVSGIAVGVVSGFGPASYRLGIEALVDHLAAG
jgi:3-dehydroquinate dehydratase-2